MEDRQQTKDIKEMNALEMSLYTIWWVFDQWGKNLETMFNYYVQYSGFFGCADLGLIGVIFADRG